MRKQDPVTMLEILYPVFQGYDSVALKADIELGGSDQLFNLLVGRDMQKIFSQDPQIVMTMPLLVGTDGVKKMSKSYGNYIGLTDSAKDMFGKIMSISDELMMDYYRLLTQENTEEIKKLHPMQAKKNLAKIMVEKFYGRSPAQKELKEFERVFSEKELPENLKIHEFEKDTMISDIICKIGFAQSKNQARRLLTQGAVKLDGKKITQDIKCNIRKEVVLQSGRKNFCKIKIKK
jgi:tyrosyl-tRNA synthetase